MPDEQTETKATDTVEQATATDQAAAPVQETAPAALPICHGGQ